MKGKNEGYDADKDEYCDLVEAGIIDPAKVVRTALQNAASVACLLLTTSCLIVDIPKEKDDHPATATAAWAAAWAEWAAWAADGWHGWHGRHGRCMRLASALTLTFS